MPEVQGGTHTLLFTDIEGSTRLVKQLRSDYGEVLAEHRELLREAFRLHGGNEIDTQGDAFFVVFERAKDAMAAAAWAANVGGPVQFRQMTAAAADAWRPPAPRLGSSRAACRSEIAKSLVVSERTVKTHVAHVLMKMDLRDRVQAVVMAYECGLVQPGGADSAPASA